MKEGAEGTTPHTKTNNKTTTRVVNHAYIHMPRPCPCVHRNQHQYRGASKGTWGRSQGQGDRPKTRKKKHGMANNTTKKVWEGKKTPWYEKKTGRRGMNATRCRPHPHSPYTLHTLSLGETQGMTKRYVIKLTRFARTRGPCPPQDGKEAAWYGKQQNQISKRRQQNTEVKTKGEERYERHPPPATPTQPVHLAHALYRGNTQRKTMRYVIEPCLTGTRRPRRPQDGKEEAWYDKQRNQISKGKQGNTKV